MAHAPHAVRAVALSRRKRLQRQTGRHASQSPPSPMPTLPSLASKAGQQPHNEVNHDSHTNGRRATTKERQKMSSNVTRRDDHNNGHDDYDVASHEDPNGAFDEPLLPIHHLSELESDEDDQQHHTFDALWSNDSITTFMASTGSTTKQPPRSPPHDAANTPSTQNGGRGAHQEKQHISDTRPNKHQHQHQHQHPQRRQPFAQRAPADSTTTQRTRHTRRSTSQAVAHSRGSHSKSAHDYFSHGRVEPTAATKTGTASHIKSPSPQQASPIAQKRPTRARAATKRLATNTKAKTSAASTKRAVATAGGDTTIKVQNHTNGNHHTPDRMPAADLAHNASAATKDERRTRSTRTHAAAVDKALQELPRNRRSRMRARGAAAGSQPVSRATSEHRQQQDDEQVDYPRQCTHPYHEHDYQADGSARSPVDAEHAGGRARAPAPATTSPAAETTSARKVPSSRKKRSSRTSQRQQERQRKVRPYQQRKTHQEPTPSPGDVASERLAPVSVGPLESTDGQLSTSLSDSAFHRPASPRARRRKKGSAGKGSSAHSARSTGGRRSRVAPHGTTGRGTREKLGRVRRERAIAHDDQPTPLYAKQHRFHDDDYSPQSSPYHNQNSTHDVQTYQKRRQRAQRQKAPATGSAFRHIAKHHAQIMRAYNALEQSINHRPKRAGSAMRTGTAYVEVRRLPTPSNGTIKHRSSHTLPRRYASFSSIIAAFLLSITFHTVQKLSKQVHQSKHMIAQVISLEWPEMPPAMKPPSETTARGVHDERPQRRAPSSRARRRAIAAASAIMAAVRS